MGVASRTCCSIQECCPLMAARNCRISLVLSVLPAPDSPLSRGEEHPELNIQHTEADVVGGVDGEQLVRVDCYQDGAERGERGTHIDDVLVVADEQVAEDAGFVEVAQADHVLHPVDGGRNLDLSRVAQLDHGSHGDVKLSARFKSFLRCPLDGEAAVLYAVHDFKCKNRFNCGAVMKQIDQIEGDVQTELWDSDES
ncbi:hypothetical protein EYF80_027819 [Liparis tanakae]|uniref:Uncharacterized protein n=1 Tax=Liparis tanakae TaxID=230148 RepID=A0A4Z2HAR8_9TELE|nr:hypothetical protein EYF80_027819 [Liparis tanakae]